MKDQSNNLLEDGILIGIDKTLKVIQGLAKGISLADLAESQELSIETVEKIKATVNLASTWLILGRQ